MTLKTMLIKCFDCDRSVPIFVPVKMRKDMIGATNQERRHNIKLCGSPCPEGTIQKNEKAFIAIAAFF